MDIEFGDIREAPLVTSARPDVNHHLAVCPVFAPGEEELAIFVDLDTLREIETHAAEDTSIELGGVLLGQQCKDEQGKPFVLVTDSLRAEHYEATKGSFKFTHDTWQQINARLDAFPEETRMVGWYHTHPDWGVFLSGMDLFICEHFFAKELDVALVVDPCRHDCGFFEWTEEKGGKATRRTGGFYLFSSRFRQAELASFADWLEDPMMSSDPRFRGTAVPTSASPIIQVGNQSGWQLAVLMLALTLQFGLLALVAWRVLPGTSAEIAPRPLLTDAGDSIGELEIREAQLAARAQLLDRVIAEDLDAPQRLVSRLVEQEQEMARLEGHLRAHETANQSLEGRLATLQSQLESAERRQQQLQTELDKLRLAARGTSRQSQQAASADTEPDEEEAVAWPRWWIAAAAVVILFVGGIAATLTRGVRLPPADDDQPDDAAFEREQ